jgi:hypothetical protein
MFEQTVSLWRRLTGRGQQAPKSAGGLPDDERRVWVRHPSNVETLFAPAGTPEEEFQSARIRDVSQGGVNLLVPCAYEPGELLTVSLPSSEGHAPLTVLACVVHCHKLAEGEYALGCNFSQELSEEDLRAFGAHKVRPSAPDDGRNWTRFACNVTAVCQTASAEPSAPWTARLSNISANGMGLLVDHDIPTGTLLSAELRGQQRGSLTILACVVHATVQPDGQRVVGCNFIRELTEADLKALI